MDETKMKISRFSSCRGVAFEINPGKVNPFAIAVPPKEEQNDKWIWIPWTRRGSVSGSIQRSPSRASSHFCDLEFDEEYIVEGELIGQDHDLERQETCDVAYNDQIQKQQPKPAPRKDSRLSIILLDQGLFTVYKRLFVACLTLNILALVLAVTGHFPYAKKKATLFSIGNILALTLCRSEALLRVVFWLAVKLLGRPWVPLCFKTATTSVLQSLGGIHSGCGVSSIAWLVYALTLAVKNKENYSQEIIALASTILALISLSSLAAFPLVRHLHHNVFERTHRFAGWTALVLVWFFVVLTECYVPDSKMYDFRAFRLTKSQEFWLTFAITVVIILPWVTTRRVTVEVSAPSDHATIIKFQGGVEAGLLGRISPSPLSEWHAFGIISNGQRDHMMLAGAVGDFTKSLVSNPPSHLWVREVHFAGLPYLINMYQKVVLTATGSGLCVFLSFLMQPSRADVYLVWVAKGIEQNFGKEIKEMVERYPKEKVIVHDTAVLGRPNVAQMTVDAARSWNAEVVIVTSNPQGSRDVVNACKGAGIPAFGPIWDS